MKQFLIIGCGRFGSSCAEQLMKLGNEVIAIDKEEEVINEVSKFVTHAVAVENINEEVLKSLGASNVDVAIIAISSNFEQAILSVVSCRKIGIPKVIVKAKDKVHADVLMQIGADKVVIPESDSAIRLARSISSNQIFDYIEFDEKYSIVELVPKDAWIGKSLNELNLRTDYGINIIAINNEEKTIVNPNANYVIKESDFLIVAGENKDLDKLTDDDGADSRYQLYRVQ
ncbi:MAG: TrkA family potassium uptake protein [Anaerococcus sp.]|jgi:trk system potassium uptake protein TrkA|nr:TrkA family potassium uptake protein [Peptoniphilaceae bacterium]MDY3055522.1 TrkA family potassium uptake protein [Anaerococcus sp.]